METNPKRVPRRNKPTVKVPSKTAKTSAPESSGKRATPAAKTAPRPKAPVKLAQDYEFDVCLSFAGEDRVFVDRVVVALKKLGIRYFYDKEVKAQLWGEDLFTYLDSIYQEKSRYCVVFISEHYKKKLWTNHERQSAQARGFKEMGRGYILPIRLDDADIPGIRLTTGYLDGRRDTPSQIADTLRAKLDGTSAPALKPPRASNPRSLKADAKVPSAAGRAGKVSTSGKWILVGEDFYSALTVEETADELVTVQISPKSPREEADLRSLGTRPHWQRKGVAYAHGNDAALCQIQDVQIRSQNGKPTVTLVLKLERTSSGNLMEVTFNGVTAEQIAEKRARLILLGEPIKSQDRFLSGHIGYSSAQDDPMEAGVVAKMWKSLGENSPGTLQKVRLACLSQLKAHGIVEHVHHLTLGPVTREGIAVNFEGRRHVRYANEPAATVTVSGVCRRKAQ